MSSFRFHRDRSAAACVLLSSGLLITACGGGSGMGGSYSAMPTMPSTPAPMSGGSGFADVPLVSNSSGVVASAKVFDVNLRNPWGIAFAPGNPFWIADNYSNVSTLYTGTGTVETQAVTGSAATGITIPASVTGMQANPTGEVFNGTGGFMIMTPTGMASALFLWAGEGGTIAAWAGSSGSTAVTAYDDGMTNSASPAVYKGLALGSVGGVAYLYATDLAHAKVDVFDTTFAKPAALQGKFVDPNLPAGYAPFGIAAVNGQLYVTFAMQNAAKHDEMTGAGMGYVDIFDFSGNFVSRFASGGVLNAPWGIAVAPTGFGSLAGDILIGNFGDGTINAFVPNGTGLATSSGPLMTSGGTALAFPGLWSLVFGNGDADKPVTTLYYTAGFATQSDGVFGAITVATSTSPGY